MTRKRNIPSQEDFKRASAVLKKRSRGLSEVRDRVLNEFNDRDVIHNLFIFDLAEHSFAVRVFFRWDHQIIELRESEFAEQLKDFTLDQLEIVGRGRRDDIHVAFEFDSYENVEKNYEGDYLLRLR